MITSTANPRVKALARLRDRSARDETGHFVIEGARAVQRVVAAGWPCAEGYVAPELAGNEAAAAAEVMRRSGITVTELGADAFRKACYRSHPDGVLAVGRARSVRPADLALPENALLLVVEAVEKPGNLGAMLRTADAAGADAVLITDPATDPFNPNVVRASQGALFTVPFVVDTAERTVGWLREFGVAVVTTMPAGGAPPWEVDLTGPTAIVIGSEHTGLSDLWQGFPAVRLPMLGTVDSLNASTTAAILLYEARRQRS